MAEAEAEGFLSALICLAVGWSASAAAAFRLAMKSPGAAAYSSPATSRRSMSRVYAREAREKRAARSTHESGPRTGVRGPQ